MLKKALKTIEKYNMLQKGDNVVVGLSGGADSVALLNVLCSCKEYYGINVYALHVNHGIRGSEANRDMEFCKEVCKRLNVEITVKEYDIPAISKEMGIGSEECGRIMRYRAFNELSKSLGGSKIAVAHNENDNAETVIMRICRGTGIKGLCGIPPVRDNIIRPLIECSRKEIESYLSEIKFSFMTDSTNLQDDYTRNKIRNNVIPILEEGININAVSNIASAAEIITEEEELLEYVTNEYFLKTAVEIGEEKIVFDSERFNLLHDALKGRVIRLAIKKIAKSVKDVGKIHSDGVKDIFVGKTGRKISLPYGLEAQKQYEKCIIKKEDAIKKAFYYNISTKETFIKESGIYIWLSYEKDDKAQIYKCFDREKTGDIFWVRNRENADRIDINIDGRSRKIKDILIDNKVPRDIRDTVPVIGCENGILWVFDYRSSITKRAYENNENKIYINVRRKDKWKKL